METKRNNQTEQSLSSVKKTLVIGLLSMLLIGIFSYQVNKDKFTIFFNPTPTMNSWIYLFGKEEILSSYQKGFFSIIVSDNPDAIKEAEMAISIVKQSEITAASILIVEITSEKIEKVLDKFKNSLNE